MAHPSSKKARAHRELFIVDYLRGEAQPRRVNREQKTNSYFERIARGESFDEAQQFFKASRSAARQQREGAEGDERC